MARTKVFVSYSHQDRAWLEKLRTHLAVLERKKLIHVWSDTRIAVGADWQEEVDEAMREAKVAVLLITPGFLASDYIWDKEVPILWAHKEQGMEILPLIMKPCAWRLEEQLAGLEARPVEGRPLSTGSEVQVDLDLTAFVYELADRVLGGQSKFAAEERERAEQLCEALPTLALSPAGQQAKAENVRQPVPSALQALLSPAERSLPQTWSGIYHPSSQLRLIISVRQEGTFQGEIHYATGQTTTRVEGSFEESMSTLAEDVLWSSLNDRNALNAQLALRFKETGYMTRGNRDINFEGEYRAFIHGASMSGAWFSDRNPETPVGFFDLKLEQ